MPPISLRFSHPDFYVIDKPSGTPMHDKSEGVITRVRELTGDDSLYLCHRLDTVTSGCLLIARNAQTASVLSQQFANREIQKIYLAILSAKPSKKQGTIAGDMINRRGGQHALLKSRDNPAVTQFFSYGIEQVGRVAVVKPLTGKTHQIRVALKSLGAPIIGDTRYGGAISDRVYLYAYSLSFAYQGKQFDIMCPPLSGELFSHPQFHNWFASHAPFTSLIWPKFALPKKNGFIGV